MLLLTGCKNNEGPGSATSSPSNEVTTTSPAIEDDLGRRVVLPPRVRRVISLAPALTEILFAIGAGDQVVGVTTFDNYPPEVAGKERVGGFSRESIQVEKLLALEPDVIFSAGSLQRDLIEELERLGMVVVALEPNSLEGVYDDIRLAGRITGHSVQADEVVKRVEQEIAAVRATLMAHADRGRPRVFYQVWHRPMRTASSASFLGQLIDAAGGENIFAGLREAYPLVNEEAVLAADPEVILMPAGHREQSRAIFESRAWQHVDAVRHGRIHELDEDVVSRPGPRVGQAVWLLARTLYPDLFPEGAGAAN